MSCGDECYVYLNLKCSEWVALSPLLANVSTPQEAIGIAFRDPMPPKPMFFIFQRRSSCFHIANYLDVFSDIGSGLLHARFKRFGEVLSA